MEILRYIPPVLRPSGNKNVASLEETSHATRDAIINNVTHKIRFQPRGRSLNVTVLINLVVGQEYVASHYLEVGLCSTVKDSMCFYS